MTGPAARFYSRIDPGDLTERYKGLLDDIRIYNSVLTQTEIGSHMNEK